MTSSLSQGVGPPGSQQDERDSEEMTQAGALRALRLPNGLPSVSPPGPQVATSILFLYFSRLVWARVAAEIQGDGEDICQHRVQVLQLQRPPTVSPRQSLAMGLDVGVGFL